MEMLILEQKKKQYLEKIDKISKESYNNEQKNIAKQIIEASNENNIDSIYQLISQRVKTGFVFDAAPEINHNCVALINEMKELNIISPAMKSIDHSLIIGENYDALKNLLATYINPKNGEGMINVIYIDPPYNTEKAKIEGNDYKDVVESSKFIYRDKYTRDGWLNLINERLKLARKLLTSDGVIFVSIDDGEYSYLKVLMDEIYGENNYVGSFVWRKKSGGGQTDEFFVTEHEYILVYRKSRSFKWIDNSFMRDEKSYQYEDDFGKFRLIPLAKWGNSARREDRPTMYYPLINPEGKEVFPIAPDGSEGRWRIGEKKSQVFLQERKIEWKKDGQNWIAYEKDYYTENSLKIEKSRSILMKQGETGDGTKMLTSIFGTKDLFENPKPVKLIKYLLSHVKSDIVLDFFAGSGTTGQAVMELNEDDEGSRHFILVTNNENNIANNVTRERLYRVINGKGSNSENIDWIYTREAPCLDRNSLTVFGINYHELKLNDFDKAKALIPVAEAQFKKINPDYKPKDRFDIYNELSALNPYKKV